MGCSSEPSQMESKQKEKEEVMAEKFTGTATYESPKDKADAKEYADMRKAKEAYFEEREKQLNTGR